jgi:hypothetical protein
MPTQTPIKPYEGPPPTKENFTEALRPDLEEAAIAQNAAAATGIASDIGGTQGFVATVPIVRPKALRPLDLPSQRNLDQLRRQMRSNPPQVATVINLHPFPLFFPSTDIYLRGIIVPACNPGQDFAWHHIKVWSPEKAYEEGDSASLKFSAVLPIHKAAQFLRAFADPETYGGGVIIYEGGENPRNKKEVETYQQDGRPLVKLIDGIEEDQEGHQIPTTVEIPIKRNLYAMIDEHRERRNRFYKLQVKQADTNWKSGDDNRRKLVTDRHRLFAEVLYAEHIIPVLPDWDLATRLEAGLAQNNCKSCGSTVPKDAYQCKCGNIVDALAAYKDYKIEFEHAKMEMLSPEQYAEAEKVRDERAQRRAKKVSKAAKPKPVTTP